MSRKDKRPKPQMPVGMQGPPEECRECMTDGTVAHAEDCPALAREKELAPVAPPEVVTPEVMPPEVMPAPPPQQPAPDGGPHLNIRVSGKFKGAINLDFTE